MTCFVMLSVIANKGFRKVSGIWCVSIVDSSHSVCVSWEMANRQPHSVNCSQNGRNPQDGNAQLGLARRKGCVISLGQGHAYHSSVLRSLVFPCKLGERGFCFLDSRVMDDSDRT